jgi:hypothetical protein
MLEVVPREEPAAERLGVLVGAEPSREVRPVLERLELGLGEGVFAATCTSSGVTAISTRASMGLSLPALYSNFGGRDCLTHPGTARPDGRNQRLPRPSRGTDDVFSRLTAGGHDEHRRVSGGRDSLARHALARDSMNPRVTAASVTGKDRMFSVLRIRAGGQRSEGSVTR